MQILRQSLLRKIAAKQRGPSVEACVIKLRSASHHLPKVRGATTQRATAGALSFAHRRRRRLRCQQNLGAF